MSIPESAEFVIIGGGAMGCGIAYALARSGKTDVVVVERRSQLALGTTSQGAGLCGQVRTTPERTRLAMCSAKTFAELQAASAPVKPDWREVGSLRLATNPARVEELQSLAQVCREAGLEVEVVDVARAERLWPRLCFEDVLAALWCPTDGYMTPSQVAKTYEYYCREYGVTIVTDVAVENVELRDGRVAAVRTNRGTVQCRYAVNAAGPHAYHVARMVELELPIVPLRHQYLVTAPITGLEPSFPVLRIPETGLYARVENDGLLLGGWEDNCVSLTPSELNGANGDPRLEPDWPVLKTFARRFEPLLPEVSSTLTARVAKGWPTFTPDGRFIVGKSSQVPGFVMAGGCNAHGISGSPGLGLAFVESLFSANPSAYVQSLSPDRFLGVPWTWQSAREQAEALCRNYYEMVFDGATNDRSPSADVERRLDPSDGHPREGHIRIPPAAAQHRGGCFKVNTMSDDVPSQARAVVVGGGIVGCSVAYHLASLGWQDTLVLEQGKIAGGTTWHSAGQVGRLRVSRNMTEVNKYSAELYARLEAETGVPTGWKATGSLMVAASADRMTQLRRTVAMGELFGVEAHLVDTAFVADKWPLMRTGDLHGAAWIPGDGKVNPEWTTRALAAGARQRGVKIVEGVRVNGLIRDGKHITGVQTANGPIHAQVVVLCGGMWTRQLGLECGINFPLYPVEHHYVVTEPLEEIHDDLPMIRDPDALIYVRPDGNTLLLGGFQAYSKPWPVDRIPDDFSFRLLAEDWPKFADPLAAGKHRLPILETAKFPRFVNGPESFTPDNNFLLGPPAGIEGCYLAAGFNSAGIACAGGAGKLLAEWIDAGEPPCDLWSVDPRRFAPWHNDTALLRERVSEVLGWHYLMAWPNREPTTARGVRKSPLYDRLAAAGACFGAKMGWERPNFFVPPGVSAEIQYAWGRQNWFPYSAAEHHAVRGAVAIFDQSSFGKFLCEGPDALDLLQWLCANNIDVPPGRVIYTAMLNRGGTFESDLTIARLDTERFYLVTSTNQVIHDFDWIGRNTPGGLRVSLTDVTGSYGVLGLAGPRSRDVLARVTDAAVDNGNFAYGTTRTITIGDDGGVIAMRINYVGELGWELHVPIEQLPQAYEAIWQAGRNLGLVNGGHYAINSLRLEKGYCAWGADISADENPLEAGLRFAVADGKNFLGREALDRARQKPLRKRRVIFVLEESEPVLWGGEPIWRDGYKVGYTTSGAYGHTLGAAVAMGYVPLREGESPSRLSASAFEIETDGHRYPAKSLLRSPYDPTGARMRS